MISSPQPAQSYYSVLFFKRIYKSNLSSKSKMIGIGHPSIIQTLNYWLSEHPKVANFRWNNAQSWGSSWSFLIIAITTYVLISVFLHFLLRLVMGRKPIPLGPLQALHSLVMALVSATIFVGMLLSAASEIRDISWSWRRTKTTPLIWLFCFPIGTRPSGRVFFWSYVFYLSRFLHLLRTCFSILRYRRLTFTHLFNKSILVFMSFLWLEFSQSFQVLAILSSALAYSAVYGYRFWTAIGLPRACFPFVVNCQFVLLGWNLVCHVGVLLLHFSRGGCNGIEAWLFNSVLNGVMLLLFVKFYWRRRRNGCLAEDESTRWRSELDDKKGKSD